MRKPFWTKKDEEARKREDEKAKGCLGEGAGCAGEGCLIGGIAGATCLLPVLWLIV